MVSPLWILMGGSWRQVGEWEELVSSGQFVVSLSKDVGAV